MGRAARGLGRAARTRGGGPCLRPRRRGRSLTRELPKRSRGRGRAGPGEFASCGTAGPGWLAPGPATRSARDRGRRGWCCWRRVACLFPGLRPRGQAGSGPLATCRRNAPTSSACLTWLESKNKKNYDAGEACEREKRFHFSPTKASWRDSPGCPRPSSRAHLVPRGGKAQRHCSLRPRWPLPQLFAGREGGWPLQITEPEA